MMRALTRRSGGEEKRGKVPSYRQIKEKDKSGMGPKANQFCCRNGKGGWGRGPSYLSWHNFLYRSGKDSAIWMKGEGMHTGGEGIEP